MEKFEYRVKDQEGQTRKGLVEAVNQKQAVAILREKGWLVVSLRIKKQSPLKLSGGFLKRVSIADKVNFTRQFSTMINAGLPITEALSILETQSRPAMSLIISEILREVESGASLADALSKHSNVFNQVYVSLIRAGEAAGTLDQILLRLADNLEKQKEFRNRVKGAMVYPAIVIAGMIIVAAIMIIFVIPKMTAIYEEFQAELPVTTKLLLKISKLITSFWWLVLPLFGGLVLVIVLAFRKPEFKKYLDRVLFKLPIIGNLNKQMVLTEFTRTLGLLVGAGILIVDALNVVRHSFQSSTYEKAVVEAASEVEKGLPLAVALGGTEVFPPILPQMIAVGEETGKLDEVLRKLSVYFEQEADVAIKGLTTALEPLIMIILGIGVGFLIIAIIMPIYNLTSQF